MVQDVLPIMRLMSYSNNSMVHGFAVELACLMEDLIRGSLFMIKGFIFGSYFFLIIFIHFYRLVKLYTEVSLN